MLWFEIRRSLRELVRRPGLTALAVVSLALGIGVNTAVFSLVDAVMLRPLAAPRPAELRTVMLLDRQQRVEEASWPEYEALRDKAPVLNALAAYSRHMGGLTTPDGNVLVYLHGTSANYFEVLGVKPKLGRLYSSNSPEPGGVVLGHSAWLKYFGGNPAVVGNNIFVNRRPMRVLAVMPPDFLGAQRGQDVGLWVSDATWFGAMGWERGVKDWELLARVPQTTTEETVAAQANLVMDRLIAAGETEAGRRVRVAALQEGGWTRTLVIGSLFFSTVGLVILIAGLNVANLGLVRNEIRRREIGVRLALGAARRHLARQLFVDGCLLSLFGAAFGLVLASWLMRVAPAVLLGGMQFPIALDARLLLFTFIVLALSTFIVALAPILDAWRRDVLACMRGDSTPSRMRWRAALATLQVILCTSLIYSALLFSRSMGQVMNARPGMDPDRNLLITEMQAAREQDLVASVESLAQELAALPGVRQVAWVRRAHLAGSGGGATLPVQVQGFPDLNHAYNQVSANYFAATGARILQGRPFQAADSPQGTPVVIVNQLFARQFFPTSNALGQWIRVKGVDRQIVGVAENGPINDVRETPMPYLYLPFAQFPTGEFTFLTEAEGDAGLIANSVRERLRTAGAQFELTEQRTWREHLGQANSMDRSLALISAGLACMGIVLAMGGLFGVLLYSVTRRTRDFGLRLALGAAQADIIRGVLRDGLRLAAVGIPLGLLAAVLLAWSARAVLYGVQPYDFRSLAGSAASVIAIVLISTLWPARRAAKVDPIEALRHV